jgi:hypothetical protein
MEDQNKQNDESWNEIEKSHRRGKIIGGLLIVTTGFLFLARELGVEMPVWLFTWKVLLIALGVLTAVKHKFMHPGWIILIAVGGAFLLNDIYPEMNIKPILWPSLIIIAGLIIMFKPRRRSFGRYRNHWRKYHKYHHKHYREYGNYSNREEPTNDDFIDSTAVMAGVKKNILTKNFKGGEITNVFGGSEINMSQADFEGTAKLEITQVFGGTKLIVPANWEIRSEQTVTVFGSIEDKRASHPNTSGEPAKVLIITGVTVFGGIDIRSF